MTEQQNTACPAQPEDTRPELPGTAQSALTGDTRSALPCVVQSPYVAQSALPGDTRSALPSFVAEIIARLEAQGHEAYAVGGCVRDLLLGRQTSDYDIATSALWPQVEAIFEKTLPTGSRFGSGTVLLAGGSAQVTTYRTEQGYSDRRRPERVEPTHSLRQDLLRRDFTINTLCWHPAQGVLDLLDGCADLRRGLIRCVGNPRQRFGEDALRILRAFRFSCQLGFAIEPQTLAAALSLADTLSFVSAERVTQELDKILLSPQPSLAAPLLAALRGQPLPGDIALLDRCPPSLAARYAALLRLAGGQPGILAHRLRLPARLLGDITALARLLEQPPASDPPAIKEQLRRVGPPLFFLCLDTYAALTGGDTTRTKAAAEGILQRGEPYAIAHLAVGGSDLTALGLAGPAVGAALERLLALVIADPRQNRRETLLEMAQELK